VARKCAVHRIAVAVAASVVSFLVVPLISAHAEADKTETPIHFNLRDPRATLPRTVAQIEEGMNEGLQVGAQIYVARGGKPIADFGIGMNRPDVPMDADTMMIWYSATKPLTAACVLQQWERGKLDLDDPVAKHIPEFAQNGKDKVTIRHVLTHTSCFPRASRTGSGFRFTNHMHVKRICNSQLEDGWELGKTAQYHPLSGFIILGEIVERVDGRPFEEYIREELFLPLGMKDCWVGMPRERHREYGTRIGMMHNTDTGTAVPAPSADKLEGMNSIVNGAAAGRGPMRELAQFYEMLRRGGELNGTRVLKPETVAAMTKNQRPGAVTPRGEPAGPWGLGISLGITPRFGTGSASKSFGHGGSQSSIAFCDLDNDVVVAMVFNGRPGAKHARRTAAVGRAIYEDLEIVSPGAAIETEDDNSQE